MIAKRQICGAVALAGMLGWIGSAATAAPADEAEAGLRALRGGNNAAAIERFTTAIREGLSGADLELAYLRRGEAYIGIGKQREALSDLDKAELIDPSDQEIASLRARAQGLPSPLQQAAAEPARPVEPAKAAEPPRPIETVKAAEPARAAEPAKPAEPVRTATAEPAKATEPPMPVAPVKAAEPVRAAKPVKAAEPVRTATAEPMRPDAPAKATEPPRSVGPVKTAEPVRSAEPVKAAEPVRTVEPVKATEPTRTATAEPPKAAAPAHAAEAATADDLAVIRDSLANPDSLEWAQTWQENGAPKLLRRVILYHDITIDPSQCRIAYKTQTIHWSIFEQNPEPTETVSFADFSDIRSEALSKYLAKASKPQQGLHVQPDVFVVSLNSAAPSNNEVLWYFRDQETARRVADASARIKAACPAGKK